MVAAVCSNVFLFEFWVKEKHIGYHGVAMCFFSGVVLYTEYILRL
jgi:hypothetical protein